MAGVARWVVRTALAVLVVGSGAIQSSGQETVGATLRSIPNPRPVTGRRPQAVDPFDLISSASLLRYLDEITSIRPYDGWRTCGSAGDQEMLGYLERKLRRFSFLVHHGLEIEREDYRTITGVVFHTSQLEFEIGSVLYEIPADALSGHPYQLSLTRLYDSDGALTDSVADPVEAYGPVEVLLSLAELESLGAGDLEGRIAVFDFALIDRMLVGTGEAADRVQRIFDARPLGLVAVTSDSLEVGESHGSFAGDSSVLGYVQADPPLPVLVAQIENMGAAGLQSLADLERVASARMIWDVDIVSPGESGNIVARIPGRDSSRATVLSAHHDSPNCPGALDDGSGTASLLEVARVLDRSRTVPPVDVYLVWFGCEERGLFGSPYFASTHQDLLDRSLGMIEMDGLARSLDGLENPVNLESWSYERVGNQDLPFPEFLRDEAADRGVETLTWDFHWMLSDISGFIPYDVPNALIDNLDLPATDEIGSAHYTAHWHTPYDTVEHAAAESSQFERLTGVMLSAALDTGEIEPDLRVTPAPTGRSVFLANHTESPHMAPYLFTDLGTILAWEGLDLDLVPYGEELTSTHLLDADVVVVLPVHDFPNELADPTLYDEAWSDHEVSVLTEYVDGGGLLILTNSAARLGPFGRVREANEDWDDANRVAGEFGIGYLDVVDGREATVSGEHPVVAGVDSLAMVSGNCLSMSVDRTGFEALAWVGEALVAAQVESGSSGGEIIALGDVGMLVSQLGQPSNFTFWQNLARYAANR